MHSRTLDPNAGTAALMTMTAHGWVKAEIVQAYIREEAARLATQEPLEVEHA